MPKKVAQAWAYGLPSTLLLMVPFDLLASLAMDVYLPVIPLMPAALATSSSLIQFTLSAYILILGLGQLVFGPLSDRIGRRPVVLGGAGLFAIASILLALASSGGEFLVLRVVQALGASASLVGTFATVRDVFADRPESTIIYGLFSSILAFVPAVGPILGAAVAMAAGWRAIFAMLGVLAVMAFVQAWLRWTETLPVVRPEAPQEAHPETRQNAAKRQRPAIASIISCGAFWVYTVGFSAAMGTFFVFFSIAPTVLIDGAGWSQMSFSLAFASVALVMILTTRVVGGVIKQWGIPGTFIRGLCVMAGGAMVLGSLAALTEAGLLTFIMPMWLIAVGIVFVVCVTANGALADFGETAGMAVALYYGIQSVIVSGFGTLSVLALGGATAWPLVAYCLLMCAAGIAGHAKLKHE